MYDTVQSFPHQFGTQARLVCPPCGLRPEWWGWFLMLLVWIWDQRLPGATLEVIWGRSEKKCPG